MINGINPAHHEGETEAEKEIHQEGEEEERVEIGPQHDDDDDDGQDDGDCRPGQVIVVHQEEEEEEYQDEDVEEEVDDEGRVGLTDVWKEAQEVELNEAELDRLRAAQEALCRSQTWYRPHSSATHYVRLSLSYFLLLRGDILVLRFWMVVFDRLFRSTPPSSSSLLTSVTRSFRPLCAPSCGA
jgi:hypothetical protein